MLSFEQVLDEVYAAIVRENEMRSPTDQIPLSPDAPLFGERGMLSSFGLVTLLLDIEDTISERSGVQITLSDERAMAARKNPFRNPSSLADYVVALLNNGSGR